MSPSGQNRFTIGASVVGAIAILAIAGFARPDVSRSEAPVTARVLGDISAPADNVACRVSGSALTVSAGTFLARIHNSGARTVTLRSLEWGWSGNEILTSIYASLDDGSNRSLWTGEAVSPAFLALEGYLALAPGEGAQLTLVFKDGAVPAADLTGPLLLGFDGGCLIVLVSEAPQECDVVVSPLTFPTTAPFAVDFDIENMSGQALSLAAFRLAWPVAENGYLLGIRIGGEEIAAFEPGLVGSPARLDLARLTGKQIIVDSGASITVRTVFERPVSNDQAGYAFAVDEQAGCHAATGPEDASQGCGVQILSLDPGQRRARLALANLEPVTRTLETLSLYWPVDLAGPVREVRTEGGQVVWTGQALSSPVHLRLDPAPVLRPQGRLDLVFVLGAAGIQDTEAGAFSSGAYSVVAHFGGECRAAYSTRVDDPAACRLSAGELTTDGTTASIVVANAGDDVRLESAGISWPQANGALVTLDLDSERLWTGAGTGRAYTITVPAGAPSWVERNGRKTVALGFENAAAGSPYAVTMSFSDVGGGACPPMLVSVRPRPVECSLALGNPTAFAGGIAVPIANEGAEPVAFRMAELTWPSDARLTRAVLEAPGGSRETVLEGARATSPASLVPSLPMVLESGTSQLLLEFAGTVAPADLAAFVAADACQARTGPPGQAALPSVIQLSGWILSLPATGLVGWWDLAVLEDTGSVTRSVWVDGGTRFDPASIDPAEGDMVTVDVTKDVDGKDRALEIRFQRAPFIEVRGTVEAISGDPPTQITVNSQMIHVADAIVDGRLVVGAVITLQGTQNPDGSITAMKVAVVDSRVGEFVEFRGVVQESAPDPDVDGFQIWNVDGRRVRVDTALAGMPDPDALPPPGSTVWVKGRFRDGMIRVVASGDDASVLPSDALVEIRGVVVQLPADGIVGPWLVATDGGGSRRVSVPSTALVDERLAEAVSGARVYIVAADTAEGLTAVRVRTEAGP